MPITKTMAYKVGNETFATFGEAQLHSLTLLFNEMKSDGACGASSDAVAEFVLVNSDKFVAILTCKPEDEKPVRKPRSDKGTKRAKAEAINRALQDGEQ